MGNERCALGLGALRLLRAVLMEGELGKKPKGCERRGREIETGCIDCSYGCERGGIGRQ